MTLGDAKRKTMMLLDEYSSGGVVEVDPDIAARMNDFFDMAQKDVAIWQPIMRRATVELDGTGDQALPADCWEVRRIRKYGKPARGYEIIDGRILYEAGDTSALVLDYMAGPQTITQQTDDSYVFEVSEQAANCMPFFVAAQQLIPDLVLDYSAFYNMYLQMRSMLPRSSTSGTGSALVQALYRG